jgi:prevent-host-death family protein
MLTQVNVTELRRNLPSYLAQVRRGQRVRVTSRGKVIAELAPCRGSADEAAAARARLRGSVLEYEGPFEPVLPSEAWEMNR